MTDDLPTTHRPVRLLARSQPSTFQVSLARVFPSCFRSSSLPFPWYIRPQHFPQYMFSMSPHHMPIPVQSSLRESLPRCPSNVFVAHLVFATLPVIIISHHLHLAAVVSRGRAKASACRLQVSLSCAVLCHIVLLQYLSRSSLHSLAGLPCRLFLSYKWFPIGSQVVTRKVHRSALMLLSYL